MIRKIFQFLTFGYASLCGADPLITLPDGTQLQGSQEGNVATFRGVPFAQPPLNELRWAPPKKWVNPNTSQIVDATQHGHACMQFFWGDDGAFDDASEDCLVLNVFVNLDMALASNDPLPVAIFVHGGAYISGMSHLPLYDGVDAVEYWNGKAILVTTNYRLNAFGFLGSEELRARDAQSGSTGNYGIQDQRLAFDWVQRNIEAFGGDPSRVTIFGESAGAGSMSVHLVNPKSKGLYSRVALESGAFSEWNAISMSCAEETYAQLLVNTGCTDVNCLLAKDAKSIKRASENYLLHSQVNGCAYAPVVDGVELSNHPWVSLTNGDVADVPILLGTNSDEGAIFTTFPHDGDETELNEYWATVGGYDEATINILTDLYVTDKVYDTSFASTFWWAAERSYGDNIMSCPSEYTSLQLGGQMLNGSRKSSTYFYHFEHLPRKKDVLTRHVCEIPYVFHQKELLGHIDDERMADVMSSWWANFFTTGNPNVGSIGRSTVPDWKEYDVTTDNVMVIKTATDVETLTHLKQNECAFFIPYIENEINTEFQ